MVRKATEKIHKAAMSTEFDPVEKWLESQHAFHLAERKAARLRRQFDDHFDRAAFHHHLTDRLLHILTEQAKWEASTNEFITLNYRLRRELSRIFGLPLLVKWRIAVLQAFSEYQFTDRAREIAKSYKAIPIFLQDAVDSVRRISLGLEAHSFRNVVDLQSLLQINLERLQEKLDDVPLNLQDLYPIKRNDKTAKERLFVHAMYRAHMRLLQKPRPDVISLLLELEGIASPLEVRQVEKLCAAYRQVPRPPRRLLTAYPWELTTGEDSRPFSY